MSTPTDIKLRRAENILEVSFTDGSAFRLTAEYLRTQSYDFFVSDTWRITPSLTLNYGLRYELNSRIKESQNRTSVA